MRIQVTLATPTLSLTVPLTTIELAERASSPAPFTMNGGTGQAAATNEDGSVKSSSNRAQRGSIITFYATGQGSALAVIGLTVGNCQADLLYAGPAPGFPGLMEINAQILVDSCRTEPSLWSLPSDPPPARAELRSHSSRHMHE
jgi:uncharacterized protein (TIGR03437 family)